MHQPQDKQGAADEQPDHEQEKTEGYNRHISRVHAPDYIPEGWGTASGQRPRDRGAFDK